MVEFRPFDPADAAALEMQDAQVVEMAAVDDWRARLANAQSVGPCWSAWLNERLIGCGGLVQHWRGRASAWCVIGRDIPRAAWVAIHRGVRARIEQAPALGLWRVEAYVALGFVPGARWAAMLGMEREGLAAGYLPDGGDAWLYARVWR